jgi:hypothetical protein
MVNYELGKIYKIVCNETGLIYIGSTAQKYLSTRLGEHKRSYKSNLDGKYPYITSFKVIGGGNFDIILLENCSCKDKYELQARERHYIETLECVNKFIPNRTRKEYREDNQNIIKKYRKDNKEKIKEQTKQYYELNKDKIKEQTKQYYELNKDKIKQYTSSNIEKKQEHSRQYYETNKEKTKEKNRQYYLKKKAEKQQVITE